MSHLLLLALVCILGPVSGPLCAGESDNYHWRVSGPVSVL